MLRKTKSESMVDIVKLFEVSELSFLFYLFIFLYILVKKYLYILFGHFLKMNNKIKNILFTIVIMM